MAELKPCPFCGSDARVTLDLGCCGRPDTHNIWCSNQECECEGEYWDDGNAEMEERARKAWNTRPEEDRLRIIPLLLSHEGVISRGRAAELLGMDRMEVREAMRKMVEKGFFDD